MPLIQSKYMSAAVIDCIRAALFDLDKSHPALDHPWTGETRLDNLQGGDVALGLKSLDLMNIASDFADKYSIGLAALDDLLLSKRTLQDWTDLACRAINLCQAQSDPDLRAQLVFQTSGTTGAAKHVCHALDFLDVELNQWQQRLKDRKRIVSLVPHHHIYGFLFGVALPSYADIPVVRIKHAMPGGLVSKLKPGDLVIGHPAFWDLFARQTTLHNRLINDVVFVNSTGPLLEETQTVLKDLVIKDFIEIYGSTETGAIGVRHKADELYRLMPYWQRQDGKLVHDQNGQLYEVQDHLVWQGFDQFSLAGRKDDMVQVGGINVSLNSLARSIEGLETSIRSCTVRLEKADFKQQLIVDVTTETGADQAILKHKIRDYFERALSVGITPIILFQEYS